MRPIAAALLAASLCLGLQPAMAANSPQDKMQACSESAARKELAGEARKLYMKGCLGGRTEKTAEQQQRTKSCSADASARHIKGDARRNFMKQCVGSGTATSQ